MFSLSSILILTIGGLIAGILNGIVGMAILTLYPILLAMGISPIMANVTATISIVFCGISSAFSAAPNVKHYKKPTAFITTIITIGGIIGTILLIKSSNGQFKKLVPFIIAFAGVVILLPKQAPNPKAKISRIKSIFEHFLLMVIGMYSGYFGAGAGILAVALLSRITHKSYNVYNTIRIFASLACNLISTVIFAILMPVDWIVIAILAISLIVGGYLGPVIVRHVPTIYLEKGIGIFALCLSVVLFIQAYL